MKKLYARIAGAVLLMLLHAAFNTSLAQPGCPEVNAGPDVNLPCSQPCTTLNATYFQTGNTTDYTVGQIPYTPFPYTGGTAVLVNIDDTWSNAIPLPFTFCFFGQPYNQFFIGSNGLISFDNTITGGSYCNWNTTASGTLPTTNMYTNSIMGPYHDIDPSLGGYINYQVIGGPPCRTFVISFQNIPMFNSDDFTSNCSSTNPQTQQIVLYETTNVIEVYIQNKEACTDWNDGLATLGIQNAAGTQAVVAPGRNNSVWDATNEGWRFTPSGPSIVSLDWLYNGSVIGSGPSVQICPTTYGLYTAQATYTPCAGGTPVVVTDDVFVGTLSLGVTIDSALNVCPGATTGEAWASINTTSAVLSYGWSPGPANTTHLTNAAPGQYIFSVTIAGCTRSDTIDITTSPAPMVVVNDSTFFTCNPPGNAGVLGAYPSGGGGAPYDYHWSNGPTTQYNTGLTAGSYTVTVTDVGGCTASDVGQLIYQSASPTISPPVVSNVSCNGGSDGSIAISVSGATQPINYTWAPANANNDTITALAAGAYSVTVTDFNGCTASATTNVTQPTVLTLGAPTITGATCAAGGSITASASGGTSGYTYSWSNGSSGSSISNLSAGPYTLTVTDTKGCTVTATYNVPAGVNAVVFGAPTITDVACNGANTGAITINVSGGTGAINVSWNTGQTSTTINGLIAGTYTVTATDATSCTASASYVVNEPPVLSFAAPVITNASCIAGGSITASASGGNGTISYAWSNGSSGASISNLSAGSYTVTATDQNNCSLSATYNVGAAPNAVIISNPVIVPVSCNGGSNGSITITTSGGSGPLSVTWSTGATGTNSINGLSAATYGVTVNDPTGCSASSAFVVSEPAALVVDPAIVTNASCGVNNGSISGAASGGTPIYIYSWTQQSNSQTYSGQTISNLAPDTYTLTVTDQNSCTATATNTITQPTPLTFSQSSTDVTCFGANDGTATITILTGNGGYQYNWNGTGAVANNTLGSLGPGTVNVTVTDIACSGTATFSITSPTQITINQTSLTNVSCFGANDGAIVVSTSGGTGTIGVTWNNGQTTTTNSGIGSGTYTVTATDQSGCTATASYVITEPAALVVDPVVQVNATCGLNNGSLTGNASGGTPSYTYTWGVQSTSAILVGQNINSLAPDTYGLVVTDQNNCTATASYVITQSPAVTLSQSSQNVSCFGGTDGWAQVTALTGSPVYSYNWNGAGATANDTLFNLSAGNVNVTVTDNAGCSATATFIISQPSQLVINQLTQTNVSCSGGNDGAITVAANGGTPGTGYTYAWSNGTIGASVTNLPTGPVTVVAADANGCTATDTYNITEPTALNVTATATDALCYEAPNGTATSTVSGGTPPYEYLWSDGQSTPTANGLVAALYTVSVQDSKGCSATAAATVGEPSAIVITYIATAVKCVGDKNGTLTITVTGATPPYNYSATQDGVNFVSTTDGVIVGLAPGDYTVIVSDNNGCTKTIPATVPDATPDAFLATTDSTSCYGPTYNDGSAHILATSVQNGPYQFSMDGGPAQYSGDFYDLSAGAHVITAYSYNGCVSQIPVQVLQPLPIVVDVLPDTLYLPLGEGGQVQVTYLNANNVHYSWTPSLGLSCIDCPNPFVTVYQQGDYLVTVSMQNGTSTCYGTATLHVDLLPQEPVFIPNTFSPNGDGNNDIFLVYGQDIRTLDLKVFNRWGELVFESDNQFNGWDGIYKGQLQTPAVFTYVANITFLNNKKIQKKGSITLLH